ncbi:MAG TPA: hypothetical protein VGJ69_15510 [Pyrinomonadaceae bacterium]|jgi:hypothetical protein
MSLTRSLIFSAIFVIASSIPVLSQERWQRLPPARDVQFYAPRNKLEEFESRESTLLIKGRTWVATLRAQTGSARVEATEIRDAGNSTRALGVTITIITSTPASEVRCLIDYDEIDHLVRAFEAMEKADDSVTKLSHFEAHYRTHADFEIIVFKQITGGIAAAFEGGFVDRSRVLLTLEEFTRLRWMIVQAKERLDEIK